VTLECDDSSVRGDGNLVRVEEESKDGIYAKVRANFEGPIFVIIALDLVSHWEEQSSKS
jgi:hypothetical protein